MHIIAAKAACFGEALKPEFKDYAAQVVKNAKAMAAKMAELGFRVVSNGTDNHVFMVDLRNKGINGADAQEALAYARHPVLGARLRACTQAMLQHAGQPASDILGAVDALKFCSCMSLFSLLVPREPLFAEALRAFCGGREDPAVLDFCASNSPLPPTSFPKE